MKVRLSKGFTKHWDDQRLNDVLAGMELRPRLRALVDAPLVHLNGALLLEPLIGGTSKVGDFPDLTGFEAFVNKIHIEDFLDDLPAESDDENLGEMIRQGVKAELVLAKRLEAHGKYRVLLSLDPDVPTIAMRFFALRDGEPWGSDDPDAFQLAQVMMVDTR